MPRRRSAACKRRLSGNTTITTDEIKMDSVDAVNILIDIILDEVARNKVTQMLVETNIETYITLACGYAKAGDWQGVSECGSQGLGFDDGDYLEPMFVMSVGGHKEHITKLLALTHPETEAFSSMASHLVVRLVNSGHGDVAYNKVQHTVDQSTEERGRMVSEEAL